jgi:hypothetical protein
MDTDLIRVEMICREVFRLTKWSDRMEVRKGTLILAHLRSSD